MIEFFQINYWHWWIVSAVLLVLELLLPGTFFLWPALASLMIGFLMLLFPMLSFEYQILIFALASLSSIIISRFYLNKYPITSDQPFLNQRGAELVGRTFEVSEAISHGVGRIRVDDTTWRVEGPDCPIGTQVKVISANNVRLKVEPLLQNKE